MLIRNIKNRDHISVNVYIYGNVVVNYERRNFHVENYKKERFCFIGGYYAVGMSAADGHCLNADEGVGGFCN